MDTSFSSAVEVVRRAPHDLDAVGPDALGHPAEVGGRVGVVPRHHGQDEIDVVLLGLLDHKRVGLDELVHLHVGDDPPSRHPPHGPRRLVCRVLARPREAVDRHGTDAEAVRKLHRAHHGAEVGFELLVIFEGVDRDLRQVEELEGRPGAYLHVLQAGGFDPSLDIVGLGVRQVGDGRLSGELREPNEFDAKLVCLLQALIERKLQLVQEYP